MTVVIRKKVELFVLVEADIHGKKHAK